MTEHPPLLGPSALLGAELRHHLGNQGHSMNSDEGRISAIWSSNGTCCMSQQNGGLPKSVATISGWFFCKHIHLDIPHIVTHRTRKWPLEMRRFFHRGCRGLAETIGAVVPCGTWCAYWRTELLFGSAGGAWVAVYRFTPWKKTHNKWWWLWVVVVNIKPWNKKKEGAFWSIVELFWKHVFSILFEGPERYVPTFWFRNWQSTMWKATVFADFGRWNNTVCYLTQGWLERNTQFKDVFPNENWKFSSSLGQFFWQQMQFGRSFTFEGKWPFRVMQDFYSV